MSLAMNRAPVFAIAVIALVALGAARRAPTEQVIRMTAKKFEYAPNTITVKKNVPVVLEITSLDRDHGFELREFAVRADITAGAVTRVRFTPNQTGRFTFSCDVFCGSGHEEMSGELIVVD